MSVLPLALPDASNANAAPFPCVNLRMALTAKIRQVYAESPAEFDPRKYLGPGREAIKQMVKHKLQVLGCAGKAAECM